MHNEISDSQRIFSMNMKFQGSTYMELDNPGKNFHLEPENSLQRQYYMLCIRYLMPPF